MYKIFLLKSQLTFLNYSSRLILSPASAFTIDRALPRCPEAQFANATLSWF